MFAIFRIACRIFYRNIRANIAAGSTVAVLILLLTLFLQHLQVSQNRLLQFYETIPVTMTITNQNANSSLQLTLDVLNEILTDSHIADYRLRASCRLRQDDILIGVNHPGADAMLEELLPQIQWADGFQWERFSTTQGLFCIAPSTSGAKPGETLSLPITLGKTIWIEMQVLGTYLGGTGAASYYCMLSTMENLWQQAGTNIYYDGFSADLSSLETLPSFKANMRKLSAPLLACNGKYIIQDSRLQQTAGQLQRYIRLLQLLFPALLILTASIGFGLSLLLLQNRHRDVAVMRSLGTSVVQIFELLMIETGLQILAGVMLGISILLLIGNIMLRPWSILLLLICYWAGSVFSAYRTARVPALRLLTVSE